MLIQRSGCTYVEDGADANIFMSYALGVCAWGLGAALYWGTGSSLTFDVESPAFNPAIFLLPVLAVAGLYSIVRGAYDQRRAGKFGKSTLEIPERGPRMGRPFSGKVFGPAFEPTDGRFQVTMRFVETFDVSERDSTARRVRENVRWEETLAVDARQFPLENGVPFSFTLPPLKELRREVDHDALVKTKATVHLSVPGMKDKTLAHKALPDQVRWTVEVSGAAPGVDYHSAFGLRVDEPVPVN